MDYQPSNKDMREMTLEDFRRVMLSDPKLQQEMKRVIEEVEGTQHAS